MMASPRQVPSISPSTAINFDTAMHMPGSGTVGIPPTLPPSVCERPGPFQSAQPLNVVLVHDISREIFHEKIFDSISLDSTLLTFLDFPDGTRAVQGALRNAIHVKGSLSTYLYSQSGADLLVENTHHWFSHSDSSGSSSAPRSAINASG